VNDLNQRGRRTILFIHGWPLSGKIFEYQMNVLPKYDVRCVTIDLRGFGRSDKPWRGYTYDQMACDLNAVIVALNLRNITLCGFSMGGAIAARYLCNYGSRRVKNLILMGAAAPTFIKTSENPCGMPIEQVDAMISQIYSDRPAVFESFSKKCFHKAPSASFVDWFDGVGLASSGHGAIGGLVALRDEDLCEDLEEIRVPTAILHGVHDQVCDFGMAHIMRDCIKSSTLMPFNHSGHALFYDEKERCNQILLELLHQ